MSSYFSLILLFVCCNLAIQSQSPVINSVTPNNTTIKRYDKFELAIDFTAACTNPYDYGDYMKE